MRRFWQKSLKSQKKKKKKKQIDSDTKEFSAGKVVADEVNVCEKLSDLSLGGPSQASKGPS